MLRFVLVGNPNAGKTTLFNALTGSTAHVGNWPGVTVEKREGTYKKGAEAVEIVDLPGIYSLSPYTPEEVIARNFILDQSPDCIVNIVDATNLERNLYLTTQLLELDLPIVVALNMTDVLDKRGDRIDARALEQRIGAPVVEISALREANVDLLMERALVAAQKKRAGQSVLAGSVLGKAIKNAEIALRLKGVGSPLFYAIKLVEKDGIALREHPTEARAVAAILRENAEAEICEDTEAAIANARYEYIEARFSPTLTRLRRLEDGASSSDRADRLLTHRWLGIPLFLIVLFAVFHLTFSEDLLYLGRIYSPGVALSRAVESLTAAIGRGLAVVLGSVGVSKAVVGLLCDGVWGGVSGVLSFLPQILVLFLLFSLLEDSGYMARVAFMLDRVFRRFGVSGRAFLPMIMGFGCSVPAMINTRALAEEKERVATVRVIPFFYCSAKMPVLLAVAGAIAIDAKNAFNADMVVCFMYILGVFIAFCSLFLMRKRAEDDGAPFIMELPDYRLPSVKNLLLLLWDKAKHFLQKAFTVIVLSCIAVWFLAHFGWDWKYVGEEMGASMLASLGKWLQPIFTPLGFGVQLKTEGWVFAVAALTGLIAKENVIATLGTLATSLGATLTRAQMEKGVDQVSFLIERTGISTPALVAFIAFNLLTIPCFAALATARFELGKKTFKTTLLFWFVTSYLVSAMLYTVGVWRWTAVAWAVGVTAFVFVMRKGRKKKKDRQDRRGCRAKCDGCTACCQGIQRRKKNV